MEIKNLVFDLGGVILNDHFADAAKIIAPKYDLDEQKLVDVFHKHDTDAYHTGKKSYEQRWQAILKDLGRTDIEEKELVEIHKSIFLPLFGVIEIVKELKEKYPLYMLSNQVAAILPSLELQYDFFKDFKLTVFSYRVGLAKPHQDIYQYLLDNAEMKAEESVFIDNQVDNIATAKEMGFATILFKDVNQLQTELINLNIH